MFIKQSLIGIVILVASGFTTPLLADQVEGLYEVELPVKSQDRDERSDAIRQAFGEVLVRVSGRANLLAATEYPAIRTALESATRFAQQYRYRKPAVSNTAQSGLLLWVRFDESAVSRLLRSQNLPVWGKTRPATLVWLVVDERGQREMIGNNSRHPALDIIKDHATRRGLPLRIPLLDLTDRSNLRVSDVWGNFESNILQASRRYQSEAVLVGRVYQGYGGWNARWSLYSDSRRRDWSLKGASLMQVLTPGIDTTALALATRYAQIDQTSSGSVLVEVRDIKTLADYNRVLKYLNAISQVSAVHPYQIASNATIFELVTSAGRLGVARAVSLGHTLVNEPVETVPIPDKPNNEKQTVVAETAPQVIPDLIYRLIP